MPTMVFPDRLAQWPFRRERVHSTSVFKTTNGRRQTRRNFPTGGMRRLTGRLTIQDRADAAEVRDFFIQRGGMAEAYYIYAWDMQTFSNYIFGTGDDATMTYTLPFGNPAGVAGRDSIITNIIDLNLTTEITRGTGPFGEDEITFGAAPGEGVSLTCDITGRERIAVANDADNDIYDFAAMTFPEFSETPINVTEALDQVIVEGETLPPAPAPLPASFLIYNLSEDVGNGSLKTFTFLPTIRRLHTAYIGGSAQDPADVSVVSGAIVFGAAVTAPEAAEKVTASYWPNA